MGKNCFRRMDTFEALFGFMLLFPNDFHLQEQIACQDARNKQQSMKGRKRACMMQLNKNMLRLLQTLFLPCKIGRTHYLSI
jgi:hypothetical protein